MSPTALAHARTPSPKLRSSRGRASATAAFSSVSSVAMYIVTAPERPRAGARLTAHGETLLRGLHALRHEPDFLALTPDEHAAIWRLIAQCRVILGREDRPLGYNLGVNVGEAAGQTVAHGPLHVIPRYAGDVLPARARYWAEG
jgi:HIT domain